MFEEHVLHLLADSGIAARATELTVPPNKQMGDLAYPCFALAKERGQNPAAIAQEFSMKMQPTDMIERIGAQGPYLNFFLRKDKVTADIIATIRTKAGAYGSSTIGAGKTIVIDFSSPNIAKPFTIGHLRSTVIGNSLYKIHQHLGYRCIGVNHLGDWGIQFAKLSIGYRLWGDAEKIEADPIQHLLSIYVKFHEEAEIRPELEEEARVCFAKLEAGDAELLGLWELFKSLSLREFKKYYARLNIHFDSWHGEAFYNDKMPEAIAYVQSKTPTEMSEGALIVNLESEKMPPVMLRKSHGTTSYHTRDIAAALYRLRTYAPERIIYVVGAEQKLHFDQLFAVMTRCGYPREQFVHVDFGLFRFAEGKISTRKGHVIFLETVLDKSIELARKIIDEKNPSLADKERVANIIGIGAIVFGDLSNDRVKNIEFSWERMLSFEGETAPYLQYTHARIASLRRKFGSALPRTIDAALITSFTEYALVSHLGLFPAAVADAAKQYKPHIIARYLLDLAQHFNTFYNACPVLNAEQGVKEARMVLCETARQTLANGLLLLGIEPVDEM